tara:strand:- start:305 stop:415 length:111 start_codon:yes stop_codon:yes gene_type:complete
MQGSSMFEPNKIQSIKSNVKHSSLFYHPEKLSLKAI